MSEASPDIVECSNCGRDLVVATEDSGRRVAKCPQCGNVMDEEENNELI